MYSSVPFALLAALLLLSTAGCGERSRPVGSVRDGGPGADSGPCTAGEMSCAGRDVTMCVDGVFEPTETCPADRVCVPGLGCRTCSPGGRFCVGNEVHICNDTGDGSTATEVCAPDEACRSGVCQNACDAAREDRSTVGCEYYAVDLDNEYGEGFFGGFDLSDAASQQFAVVLANPSDVTVSVEVEQNDAPYGSAPSPTTVGTYSIAPQSLVRIDLPQREVDGSFEGHNEGPGTFLSSQAYHITTNFPVVAYQFNPIVQDFSNDASLMIPVTGLDTHYRVLGWPTANPIPPPPPLPAIPGIPDHSSVTIIGTQESTEVRVTLGGKIVGDGMDIPAGEPGDVVTVTLGPYDVLNLESRDIPGDLTGTVVESSAPVAVFSGGERGIAPVDTDRIPTPPGGRPDDWCCTEHLEEQVFPTTAWGKDFVITRSPVRGATWREPDIYRIMADKDGTTVTTGLASPDDSFTLNAGEWRELYAQDGFILRADKPISIEQILVSQGWVDDWKPGHGGDPSMILFPPYEQYRDNYVFLVPDTFSANYVVVAMPQGTNVELDGRDVNGDEFMALCTYEEVGAIDGTTYIAATCPVDGGTHRLESTLPVGIMVYGYYNVGSYGYAGGSNLTRINFI